jgi:hypothetical protein
MRQFYAARAQATSTSYVTTPKVRFELAGPLARVPALAAARVIPRERRVPEPREGGGVCHPLRRVGRRERGTGRWRARLSRGRRPRGREGVLPSCPECARREFGPFDEGLTA